MPPFRVPLAEGESVGHWRLGRRREERFDVADQPMQGEMDPFFFLAKTKNFIPHEYPCRREFAALYRGKRPEPRSALTPEGWWFPFGSPRVDLSGFWFRPTRIECWARTTVEAERAQTARFRFATCGGASLRVNGGEIAWLAGYQRNFEEAVEVDVPLAAGSNLVEVWFGDLCERDTRYYFELSLIGGQGLSVALPVPVEAERAAEIEKLLAGMRFERPSYGAGEVAVLLPEAATQDLDVRVEVTGDFISAEKETEQRRLRRGETRIVLGTAETLPSDFRHFAITLQDGEFALTRVLAVEICDLARHCGPARIDRGARRRGASPCFRTRRARRGSGAGQAGDRRGRRPDGCDAGREPAGDRRLP